MPYYPASIYDLYLDILTVDEYAVDPDFLPYPMTEADIGEYQSYEALATDIVKDFHY
jgi:hypothetical protein